MAKICLLMMVAVLTAGSVSAQDAMPAADAPPHKNVALPGPAEHICVGGGGRYLLYSLPKQRQIAVFDAKEQRIIKALSVSEDAFFVAAGQDHLYVLLVESKILQRYSIKTLEREWAKPSPVDALVDGLVMGSASAGPLAFIGKPSADTRMGLPGGAGSNVFFFDPETLKPLPAAKLNPNRQNGMGGQSMNAAPAFVRASADGSIFTWREGSGGEGHSMGVMEIVADKPPRYTSQYAGAQLYLPAPNARFFYHAQGVLSDRLKTVLQAEAYGAGGSLPQPKVFVPAASGTLFIQLNPPEVKPNPNDPYRGVNPFDRSDKPKIVRGTVQFYFSSNIRPFARLDNVDGLEMEGYQYGRSSSRIMYDMRVQLMTDYGILVTLAESNEQINIYPLDIDKLLEAGGQKYLHFTSEPPATATLDTVFTYTPAVKSKNGGVTLKLDSGPPGMALDNGVLKWTVPKDLADPEAGVVMSAQDKEGQERFQAFRLRLVNPNAPEPVEKEPEPAPRPKTPVTPPIPKK